MDFQPLKYIYRASDSPAAYTLLLLHGTGGNETDLIPLAQNLGDNYNILSVRGNVTENGMPRFFKRLGMGVFDEDDLSFRTDELAAFLEDVAVKEGFNHERIIALGYSNGANIAGAMLVKYPELLAGAILYRPMRPFKEIKVIRTKKDVPVFLSSGKMDPTVSLFETEAYTAVLESFGYKVASHSINAGHNLINDEVDLAAQWLQINFG